jgi:hypothetical protein
MRWVIASLVVLAAWMFWLVYLVSPGPNKFLGGFLLAIGLLNGLFYKSTGRKFFAKTQSSRPFVAGFWARSGERGVQLFFLGVGAIFALAGCLLIIVGSV